MAALEELVGHQYESWYYKKYIVSLRENPQKEGTSQAKTGEGVMCEWHLECREDSGQEVRRQGGTFGLRSSEYVRGHGM